MFTPTKEQLEELGFKENIYGTYELIIDANPFDVKFNSYDGVLFIEISEHCRKLYPRSLSDLKTIIESFNPN